MSMTAADQKNLDSVLKKLRGAWEDMTNEQRVTVKTLVDLVTAKGTDDSEDIDAAIASFYRPLTEDEMFAEIEKAVSQADHGECLTIEESKARHAAKYGLRAI